MASQSGHGRTWMVIGGLVLLGAIVSFFLYTEKTATPVGAAEPFRKAAELPPVVLAEGTTDTLEVQQQTVASMRLTAQPVRQVSSELTLQLTGRLMLDPNRLVHVHTRFGGEIVKIGTTEGNNPRPLRMGDSVKAGQLLAVIWSKEVGEKKSDLVDALSQLALHETIYKNLKSLQSTGAVPQRSIDEMQRSYESDLIEVERLQRTLRSWRIDEHELQECAAEAHRIHTHAAVPPGEDGENLPADRKVEARWAEFDVRAPFDGVILEKNFTVGDIVGPEEDLYKVADLTQLLVMANIYEDDLPALLALPEEARKWQVKPSSVLSTQMIPGKIESIGNVIDPNQHTAVVWGHLANQDGQLRVGQFVEARIVIPTSSDWAEISPRAVIDDGDHVFVFVALNHDLTRLQRREVQMKRRTSKAVFVTMEGPMGLKVDEMILTRGVMELSSVLNELSGTVVE